MAVVASPPFHTQTNVLCPVGGGLHLGILSFRFKQYVRAVFLYVCAGVLEDKAGVRGWPRSRRNRGKGDGSMGF